MDDLIVLLFVFHTILSTSDNSSSEFDWSEYVLHPDVVYSGLEMTSFNVLELTGFNFGVVDENKVSVSSGQTTYGT